MTSGVHLPTVSSISHMCLFRTEVHHLVRLLRSVNITANVADSMVRLFTDDKPNKAILSHLFLIFLGWAV